VVAVSFEHFLHRVRLKCAAMRGHGDSKPFEFRNQVPVLHPKLFGEFIHTHG